MRHAIVGLAVLSVFVLGISAAEAASEVFTKPTYKGDRLAWCKEWGSGCGKGAANAYCAFLGFGDATDFSKAEDIGRQTPTRMIGNNQVCNKAYCDGFKSISCGKKASPKPDKQQAFDKPRWKGYRLDWCVKKDMGCGKDAADVFCKASGYAKASGFALALRVGITDPTKMIGSGAVCNTVICNGFQSIICVK